MLNERKLIKDWKLGEGSTWIISGFLRSLRRVGKLCFGVISDSSGKIQVIFKNPLDLNRESVLCVRGTLVKRKSPNPNIDLGEWELLCQDYLVLSSALKSLPFEITDKSSETTEKNRLKYRYLDLRRDHANNLTLRSKIIWSLKNFLIDKNFIEVNTPILSLSTKEGANTFDTIFNKDNKNYKFSLSQSPQLYKQLLMMSGVEKYFQVASCFRLEDLRSDRQYEFQQLDLEVSYFSREKLFSLIENMFKYLFKAVFDEDLTTPFIHITYKEALEKYGTDKPDLRDDLILENYSFLFPDLIRANGHVSSFGFHLEACGINVIEDKWLRTIQTKNNIYILKILDKKILGTYLMDKDFSSVDIGLVGKNIDKTDGCMVITTFDDKTRKNALLSLGNLRSWFLKTPKKPRDFRFLWIVNWPLFEFNEQQDKWVVSHHLFTKPDTDSKNFDYKTVESLAYDLVLNGVELGSGSERINDLEVQKHMFHIAGLSNNEIDDNFSWFLEAFNYGVPPHMGIALGLDRFVQVLLGTSSIREVIAFPKNNHGMCNLTNSPTLIS